MLTIPLTTEGLELAMTQSRNHHTKRDVIYNPDNFPFDNPRPLFVTPVDLDELKRDKRSGIYIILENDRLRAYVGMTANFAYRFYHGKPDHKENCNRCTCHGHINATPETCRSHIIINSPNGFNVGIIQEMRYDPELVCQAEVDWYYILLAHGIKMVNRDYALGNPNFSGLPIVSCDLSTGDYHFFPNQIGASVGCYGETSGGAGYVDVCAKGRQNQQSGYTHRLATEEEMNLYRGRRNITELIQEIPSAVEWRDSNNHAILDHSKINRLSKMAWTNGPLSIEDISALERNLGNRPAKYKKSSERKYKSTYKDSYYGHWKWKADTKVKKQGGKKLKEKWGHRYTSSHFVDLGKNDRFENERMCALDREWYIVENKLQSVGNNEKNFNFDWRPPEE